MEELHAAIAAHLRRQDAETPLRQRVDHGYGRVREVAIYARSATMTHADQAALEGQIAACRASATRQGLLRVAIYQEVIGGDTLDRPRLAALRAAIAHGWIGTVLVTTPDRLTRDPLLFELLRAEWAMLGVAIVAVMEAQ